MSIASKATDLTNPNSFSSKARQRRWDRLLEAFPVIESMRVLDLGGTPQYWQSAPCAPVSVTTVNLAVFESTDGVTAVQGDACAPPESVTRERYDLVVSNSLLEHVGGHAMRQQLADVIHRAAPRHWVQTPYRYFPIEPHWLLPGFQFLPFEARVRVTQHYKLGNRPHPNRADAIDAVNEVELVGIAQMRAYFPGSQIWRERAAGLVKSLVAISAG